MNIIQIKYFTKDIDKIAKIDKGDWIDLRAAETVEMKQGDFKLIPLGVAMKLPEGYEGHVVPRSSTYKNFGIIQTNHQAVIDESYCGNNDQWFYPAYALRDTIINKNDRICQFRIMKKMEPVDFIEVDELKDKDRGGIGSTGTNQIGVIMEKMLTVNDIQEHLHICKNTAYKLLKIKSFPKIKIGKSYIIPEDQYLKWVKDNVGKTIIL